MGTLYISDLIDLVALFVACLSLIMSFVFSYLQQKHNRNSVRPLASILFSDYEEIIRVYIKNVGNGPMIIQNVNITDSHDRELNKSDLYSTMPQIEQPWRDYTTQLEGRAMPVNGEINLISIKPRDEEIRKAVRYALSTKIITINYTDIYRTRFKEKRGCDFFGRNLKYLK